MNTNDLKIFEAVAHTRSFTKAAASMNTVQSNVTARIRVLEGEFKVNLFTRNTKNVQLTEAGQKLLSYARKLELLIEEAKQDLFASNEIRGNIAIGSLETTAALRLPPIIATYARLYPRVSLRLITTTSEELIAEVLSYRLDGAFVVGPVTGDSLIQRMVVNEELVLVSHKGLRNAKEIRQNADQLKIIVFKRGCAYRQRLEMVLSQWGIMNFSIIQLPPPEAVD